jgi:hypothetical protein
MLFSRREFLLSGVALAALSIHSVCSEEMTDLELILALDASGSMFDARKEGIKHWDIQIAGHVCALSQHDIISKLVDGRVHLRIILWSDGQKYASIFDGPIRSAFDVGRARDVLSDFKPVCNVIGCGGTDHSMAIEIALSLPRVGFRRVLDISTDEPTTSGYQSRLDSLRESFQKQDGTINALAVAMSPESEADLQVNLCTPRGFCFRAADWDSYAKALARKISAEIA